MAEFSAPWAGSPVERFEYEVRRGLENVDRLEGLTSFMVHTSSGENFETRLGHFEGEPPFTVDLAFEKAHRKLLFEVFLEKQVHPDQAATLVAHFDRQADSFTYHLVEGFGGDANPASAAALRDLAEELRAS
ncbi:hypothetical protein M3B90_07785 [Dermabacter sp. p3-SID358]|uniref:hypothetical protein n=2 Tax=Dermabacter TaxID=36739 RepID=UPI0021A5CF47|nr:hypothetical protein [Dermabacter sp. p3-SID358]MCT1867425.1 hypothetical protein [Dermabacter sp. p3-SID358]